MEAAGTPLCRLRGPHPRPPICAQESRARGRAGCATRSSSCPSGRRPVELLTSASVGDLPIDATLVVDQSAATLGPEHPLVLAWASGGRRAPWGFRRGAAC